MTETTGIFITINGKRKSLSDFLKEEEEKQAEKEKIKLARAITKGAVQSYSEITKERSSMILRRRKPKPKNKNPDDVVVNTKIFNQEEIFKQEEEIMQSTAGLQDDMVLHLARHPNKWFTPKTLMTALNIPPEKHQLTNFSVSKVVIFLEDIKLLVTEKNPDAKGRRFMFVGTAPFLEDDEERRKLIALFTQWRKEKNKLYRENMALKKQNLPTKPIVTHPRIETPVPPQQEVQESIKTIEQPILESREKVGDESPMSSLASSISEAIVKSGVGQDLIKKITTGTVNKLQISIEVRFGFLKE